MAKKIKTHSAAKLSVKEVKIIKKSKETNKALAEKYGVAPSTISDIKTGKTWGHIV